MDFVEKIGAQASCLPTFARSVERALFDDIKSLQKMKRVRVHRKTSNTGRQDACAPT